MQSRPCLAATRRALVVVGLSLLVLPAAARAQGPLADYGDAPDRPFPSRFASAGVFHLDTFKEWLGGGAVSTTSRENDSIQAGDADDGGGVFFSLPPVGTVFSIMVSYDPSSSLATDPRVLNVLVDADGDGTWEGGLEWPIRNVAVDFTGVPAGVTSLRVAVLLPPALTPPTIVGKTVRATLSTAPLANGSGAWGPLARGETEDFSAAVIPPPSKIAGIVTLFPTFTPTRPRVRHGVIHAEDGPDPDAKLDVTFPAFVVGTAAKLKLRWRRIADRAGNPYSGSINLGAGVGALPLPGAIGPYSPVLTKSYLLAPAFDSFAINGMFASGIGPGDTDVEFKVRVFYDPLGEWIMFTNENDESAVPPSPGDPNNAMLGGYFLVGPDCGLLYDNGSIVTHPGGGAGGVDGSALDSTGTYHVPHNLYGFGAQAPPLADNALVDDFTVCGTWNVSEIELFGYATNVAPPSTTLVYAQVWNGDPRVPGSSVVWGNLSTNLLSGVTGSLHAYRAVLGNIATNTNRQVQSVRVPIPAVAPLVLSPGTYWLEFQYSGINFCPPVTENRVNDTGNGFQRQGSTWVVLNNATGSNTARCGVPFRLHGCAIGRLGAIAATYGAGKIGSQGLGGWDVGVPARSPVLGLDYPLRLVNGHPGSMPVVIVGSPSSGQLVAPVGTLYVLPILSTFGMPMFDVQGVSTLRLPIPPITTLGGLTLAWQGVWVDPGAVGSIAHSGGLRLTLGN